MSITPAGAGVLTNQQQGGAFNAVTPTILDHYRGAAPNDWVAAFAVALSLANSEFALISIHASNLQIDDLWAVDFPFLDGETFGRSGLAVEVDPESRVAKLMEH